MNKKIIDEMNVICDFDLKSYNYFVSKYGENNLSNVFNDMIINCKESEKKQLFYKYYSYFISNEIKNIKINNNTYLELTKKYGEENTRNYFKELLEISSNKNEIQKKYEDIYLYVLIDEQIANNYKDDSYLSDDNFGMYLKEIGIYPLLSINEEKVLFSELQKLLDKIKIAKLDKNGSFEFVDSKIINLIKDNDTLKSLNKIKNSFCISNKNNINSYIKYINDNNILLKQTDKSNSNYIKNQFDLISSYNKLREKAINSNLRLVVSIAKRFFNRGIDATDLINEGNIGLMKAVARFNTNKECKFSTYATWWIKQSIQRYMADKGNSIRIPVHLYDEIKKYERSLYNFSLINGREPSDEEVANILEWNINKVLYIKDVKIRYNVDSLNRTIGEEEDTSLMDVIPDFNSTSLENIVNNKDLKESIADVIKYLSPREQYVLNRRFGLDGSVPKTLDEVGNELSVTRERIRQVEAKALRKLRFPSRAAILKPYLEN